MTPAPACAVRSETEWANTIKSASMTTMNINRNWIKIKGIELKRDLE